MTQIDDKNKTTSIVSLLSMISTNTKST